MVVHTLKWEDENIHLLKGDLIIKGILLKDIKFNWDVPR